MAINPTQQEASVRAFRNRITELTEENKALKAEIERLRAAAGGEQGGEGLVLVPKEPTRHMLFLGAVAGWAANNVETATAKDVWDAMIQAWVGGGEQGGEVSLLHDLPKDLVFRHEDER